MNTAVRQSQFLGNLAEALGVALQAIHKAYHLTFLLAENLQTLFHLESPLTAVLRVINHVQPLHVLVHKTLLVVLRADQQLHLLSADVESKGDEGHAPLGIEIGGRKAKAQDRTSTRPNSS